jgi:hypothetical protein
MNHKEITPLKVRYEVSEERIIVKVDRILQRNKRIVMPNMNQIRSIEYTFRCEAIQGDIRKPFTLTFNDQSCRWYMFI